MKVLISKYEELFEIIEKLSLVTFKLKMLFCFHIYYLTFHTNKLAPYNESTIKGQRVPLLYLVIINKKEEYKVKTLLDYRAGQYLVWWKGYSRNEDAWEPYKNLMKDIPNMVKVYNKKHKIYIFDLEEYSILKPELITVSNVYLTKEPPEQNNKGIHLYSTLNITYQL